MVVLMQNRDNVLTIMLSSTGSIYLYRRTGGYSKILSILNRYSKDFKKEVEDFLKFKVENIANRLNLVSREEFEVQKKLIEKLKRDLVKIKVKKGSRYSNRKISRAKKL